MRMFHHNSIQYNGDILQSTTLTNLLFINTWYGIPSNPGIIKMVFLLRYGTDFFVLTWWLFCLKYHFPSAKNGPLNIFRKKMCLNIIYSCLYQIKFVLIDHTAKNETYFSFFSAMICHCCDDGFVVRWLATSPIGLYGYISIFPPWLSIMSHKIFPSFLSGFVANFRAGNCQ